MNFSVIPSEKFKKEVRRLTKKFPSLKAELTALAQSLSAEPTNGTSLGDGIYKIRLAIKSKGKGKSGGARVIESSANSATIDTILKVFKALQADIHFNGTIENRHLQLS